MKILILLMFACAIASAQLPTPSAEDLYDRGQTAYDAGAYQEALDLWTRAYDLSHQTLLLYNLAQAYRLNGNCASALSTYKRFVAIDPTADQRPRAEDFVRELEPTCGERPAPIVEHPVAVVERPHESERPGRTLKIAGLMTGGAGITLLASGLLLGRHASALGEQVTTACASNCDWTILKDKDATGRRDAAIGRTLDAIGVAAIATGTILYYLGDRKDEIHIAPLSARSGAIVSWGRSW